MTINLVVADESRTEKTICLAVLPSLKSYGVPGRPRLFEVVQNIKAVNNQRKWKAPKKTLAGESYNNTELQTRPKFVVLYIVIYSLRGTIMEIKKYLSLLSNGEFEKAERIRLEGIPNRLIKFVGLDDSKGDEKKLVSLNQNEIWFAQKDNLNDPYEYKGMFLDRNRMEKAGYPTEIIDKYETLFDFSDYGITCLSNNSVDYLPMWAYYTNNHRGFCVEYEVIKKNCIHEVLYEPERIKVGSLIFECRDAVKNAIITGKRDKADFFSKLFLQNLFIKAESWKHEKEYRIVYPLDNGTGQNVSVSKLGMRTSRIIAGINCSEKNIVRLNEISNNLGLGNVYISKIHPEKYTIDVKRLVDCICKKSRN